MFGLFVEIFEGLGWFVDGKINFVGVLCCVMVICGYFDFKEF